MKTIFRKSSLSALSLALCLSLLLSACGSTAATNNTGSSGAGITAVPSKEAQKEKSTADVSTKSGNAFEGIWYEQNDGGGVLTVSGSELHYKNDRYSSDTAFKTGAAKGSLTELIPDDEFWTFIDIFYDAEEDIITGHDLPHTDGDGGYHLYTFKRTEYVAPPEPVYGERVDNSDPGAPKEFERSAISYLEFSVIEPVRQNGDMAPEQPENGEYNYILEVNDDGTGILTSDFCQDIRVSEEQLEELADAFFDSALPELNGTDIYTEDMPEDTQTYRLYIEFEDGQQFESSANGKDVSVIWDNDGYAFHQCLFHMFLDAGYNSYTGEFHSTLAMKRLVPSEDEAQEYSISYELIRQTRDGTAYDYYVYSEYPVFTADGDAPEELTDALAELSEHYKELAAVNLEEDYEAMANAPEDVWKNADRCYAYSFYSPTQENVLNRIYSFWLSEGHANSLGVGKYEYGYYPSWHFCIDEESGKILCVSDLFTDKEALQEAVTEALCSQYYNKDLFTSDEYQEALAIALDTAESDGGAGITPMYDSLWIYMPIELSAGRSYMMDVHLYYDAVQDILIDKYCSVW